MMTKDTLTIRQGSNIVKLTKKTNMQELQLFFLNVPELGPKVQLWSSFDLFWNSFWKAWSFNYDDAVLAKMTKKICGIIYNIVSTEQQ